MTFILHGSTLSPFVRKVVIFLEEKGIAYEARDAVPFPKTPALLERHPMGLIPYLEHEGRFVPDSSVICAYLGRTNPGAPNLYPTDPADFARALFLEEYSDTRANAAIGPILFERVVKPRAFQEEPDEARVEASVRDALPEVLDYFEGQLRPGAETLLGAFSVADAAVGAMLTSLVMARHSLDAERWPRVAAYTEKLVGRPAVRVTLPK